MGGTGVGVPCAPARAGRARRAILKSFTGNLISRSMPGEAGANCETTALSPQQRFGRYEAEVRASLRSSSRLALVSLSYCSGLKSVVSSAMLVHQVHKLIVHRLSLRIRALANG